MSLHYGVPQRNRRFNFSFSVDEIPEPGTNRKTHLKGHPIRVVANLHEVTDAIKALAYHPRTSAEMETKWGWLLKFIKDHDLENDDFEKSILLYLTNFWSLGYKKSTCCDHFNCIRRKLRLMDKYDYRCSNNIKNFFHGLDNIYRKDLKSPKHPFTTTIVTRKLDNNGLEAVMVTQLQGDIVIRMQGSSVKSFVFLTFTHVPCMEENGFHQLINTKFL